MEALPKTPTPAAPTRKAGPELLQKARRRSPSSRDMSPERTRAAAVAAPMG